MVRTGWQNPWVRAVTTLLTAAVMVMIFSEESNSSKIVLNEVSVAFEAGKTIVPFRMADIQMHRALAFCLTNVHWMDATKPPLEKNIYHLREHVQAILEGIRDPGTGILAEDASADQQSAHDAN